MLMGGGGYMEVAWCFGCVCPFVCCVYFVWFKGNCRVGSRNVMIELVMEGLLQ